VTLVRDILDVATPSMRPRWVGRTKPLTHDEIVVLRLAVQLEGEVMWRAVHALLGERRATAALSKLKKAGGIDHPRYGRYRITEKGRIAIALVNAKEARP
jgi:Mn-dependent DtxR family transcriptional regulator